MDVADYCCRHGRHYVELLWPLTVLPPQSAFLFATTIVGEDLITAAGGMDYDQMYTEFLRRGRSDVEVRVYDAVGGELPASPNECDAWIITGSRHDAHADEPWTVALRQFIVELSEHRARTVGICFGHQAVAHALGGESGPAGEWKAGPQDLAVEATPWFGGGEIRLNAMHRDAVRRLPPGAVDVGSGSTAEYPIYLVGDTILCLQDHPEFSHQYMAALIEARHERLGGELADEAMRRTNEETTQGDDVARWVVDFLFDVRQS